MNGLIALFALLAVSPWAASPGHPPKVPAAADLLFASTRDGNSEIYLRRAGQEDWINLTNHPATDNWPVWSPDGQWLVFQSNRSGNLDLWKMKADGSALVQLTQDPEPDYLPAWSPDGRTILFTSWRRQPGDGKRAPHIHAMNADGSGQRRLVQVSTNTSEGATWSPDGQRIVFARKGDKGADLIIAAADGTGEQQITHDQERGIYNGSPTFGPDGKRVAFYSDDGNCAALTIIGSDGRGRRTLIANGHNWYPRWSADGAWIQFTAPSPDGVKGNLGLFALPVAGEGGPVLLLDSPKRDAEGSWRPIPRPGVMEEHRPGAPPSLKDKS